MNFHGTWFQGFFLALGLIIPLGPQNLLIINQGMRYRRFGPVLPSVLAAWMCDMILVSAAVFGVGRWLYGPKWILDVITFAGAFFLLWLAFKTWRAPSAESLGDPAHSNPPAMKSVAVAASVTLLNPHAILDTVGVIGTSALRLSESQRWIFFSGTLVAEALWFLTLAYISQRFGRAPFAGRLNQVLNKGSSLLIAASAVFLIYSRR